MTTNRLELVQILGAEEYRAIDEFCSSSQRSVGDLAELLQDRFALNLVTDADIVAGFVTDSSNLPGRADALCRPRNARECAIIMRACYMAGIPCTICAGRSNLTGSATPEGGVVISMLDMAEPDVVVDTERMTVTAPVGMILEDLRNVVLEQSDRTLIFPVNPTSRTDAAVGGAIACNASGFAPGEIGATRYWVESLDILFPCGLGITARRGQFISEKGYFTVAGGDAAAELPVPRHARPAIKNASGPFSAEDGCMDLVDLIVGSEGLFGVVTGCTLKLEPKPDDYLDIFFPLPSERDALSFYWYLSDRLSGDFGSLSAFEYFGVNSRKYMDHQQQLFQGDNAVGIYLQIPVRSNNADEVAAHWFETLVESGCGVDEDTIVLMDNDRDRKLFLEARHSLPANSLEVVQRRGTYTIMTDTVVPPDRFGEFLDYANELITGEGMDYLSFGHLADCHIHFMIMPRKEEVDRGRELYDMIVARSAELGGVYSGEHGTGKRKRNDFAKCYGEEAVKGVRETKAAVDPQCLLNRGNVVE